MLCWNWNRIWRCLASSSSHDEVMDSAIDIERRDDDHNPTRTTTAVLRAQRLQILYGRRISISPFTKSGHPFAVSLAVQIGHWGLSHERIRYIKGCSANVGQAERALFCKTCWVNLVVSGSHMLHPTAVDGVSRFPLKPGFHGILSPNHPPLGERMMRIEQCLGG
jgi:hypothetical protein